LATKRYATLVKFTNKLFISIYVSLTEVHFAQKNIYISHNIEWASLTATHQNTPSNNMKYFEPLQSRNLKCQLTQYYLVKTVYET